jgi:hypothetical protein
MAIRLGRGGLWGWTVGSIVVFAGAFPAMADDLVTPWESAYDQTDATGPHVLGLWKFDDERGVDSSGKSQPGTFQHGHWTAEGKFGGGFESFSGHPEADRSHGFVVPPHPRLSPSGAFTLELWIKPKPEFERRSWSVVVDKKYAGNDDYQLAFGPVDGQGQRSLTLSLGFGSESKLFLSDVGRFPADEWVHLAATYDGRGKVQFFRNGSAFGGATVAGVASISAGSLPLSIGDRLGSTFPGFPGFVDEVRLSSGVREFSPLRVTTTWPRRTFVRFEPPPTWTVQVTNLRREPVSGATVQVTIGSGKPSVHSLPELAAGSTEELKLPFETSLRPDDYTVDVTAVAGSQSVRETGQVTLVPRPLPHRMPVVMWGIGGVKEVVEELPRLKKLGFTHCFGGEVDHQRIAEADGPTLTTRPERMPDTIQMMDTALANDLKIVAGTWPTYFEPMFHESLQVGRGGTELKRKSLTPNNPAVLKAFERAGQSIALTYADHPAFEAICVNSEVKDESEVSFTEWDLAAYRRTFGEQATIPDWVQGKYPPNYSTLAGFPDDRVVTADHPQLVFYRWWWGVGDGWNAAHSAVHHGLHQSSPRKDLWTFQDPVVRCPPLWGSGGDVDVLSQWTYTDPDPLRMSLPVDELMAMARGRTPTARVMKMTQLFWYRSTTAPAETSPREGSNPATWADKDPSTSFFSIHPHHLREAFWTKIARPIEGIMYHGWSSLVPTDGSHAYKYTHPQLQVELSRLTHEVVQPLGPTLKQVPAVKSDVAFLESFTSFAFTSRSTWGYAGGWPADVYFALQHAHLQPEVIYEQQLLRDGLDGYRVLVLADCEVLTREVVERIQAFQQAGGIVIGDKRLCPAIKADVMLPMFNRAKDAAKDKAAVLELAAEIRRQLDGRYQRVVETSSPDVIPHRRRAGDADYLFLVNDAREPGDYVGQYGRVHELGVPTAAEVRIRTDAQAVYDLVEHRALVTRREGADLVVSTELGPCDGSVWMTTPTPIHRVEVSGPASATIGQSWTGQVRVVDAADQPMDAVFPLHVEVRDSDGRTSEYSGHYGAAAGRLSLQLDLASNDKPGVWQIRVNDLASGLTTVRSIRVLPAGPSAQVTGGSP